ncbi:hydrolase 1, exosortase A system-associated [Nitrosomonas sp. ANs5]|uniref:hydrolase 1, exosortase A system-associated n=1 Tax=Nitrosomonas sp. ANs5 TaxID=3423941 RepID=UPI003D357A7D
MRIQCQGSWLYGIISRPQQPAARGVLIVVGGPQYRAGSHRQFVLLARYLAEQGIAVMRFDFRGMGDSDGEMRTFEDVGQDLSAAINFFTKECMFLKDVVIWGLCDAASAALFYAHQDQRVSGLVLLNPWVRTEQGIAKAYLKHHYSTRLFQPAFWKKLISGKYDPIASIRSLYKMIKSFFIRKKSVAVIGEGANATDHAIPLPARMLKGLQCFEGKSLVITSGDDLTASEFLDLIHSSKDWQITLEDRKVKFFHIQDANHTFSRRQWRHQVAEYTGDWLRSW